MHWLGRYERPFPIRSRAAFHVLAARRDGERRVVIVGGPRADRARVASALDALADAHARIDHPLVPKIERGEHDGAPFAELACDAIADGFEVLRAIADTGRKIQYGQGDWLFTSLREAMQAAHRAGICLGRVSYGNYLFSPDGSPWLFGWGHNVVVLNEKETQEADVPVFQAPEVAVGDAATPIADYVALLMMSRSVAGFGDITALTKRLLHGSMHPENLDLVALMRVFDQRFLGVPPAMRATMEDGIETSSRLREMLGLRMDPDGARAFVASLLADLEETPEVPGPDGEPSILTMSADASWILDTSGVRQKLGRAPRFVMLALRKRYEEEPGSVLSIWELLEAGWPGEQPIPEAGSNRVHVTLARLRKLGLRSIVERFDHGYRIRPGTRVRVV
jgi:hypothetical protein